MPISQEGELMKICTFFKSKKQPAITKLKKCTETKSQTIQYETKFTANDLTQDRHLMESIINKMVKEDPFKNFYTGKVDADFGPLSKRVYKYDAITTVNVNLLVDSDNHYIINVEGIELGKVPELISKEFAHYYETYLLTAYAYVTGGYYKEYSSESHEVIEGFEPYGLDLYVQFT